MILFLFPDANTFTRIQYVTLIGLGYNMSLLSPYNRDFIAAFGLNLVPCAAA
jgi:hypothetical protein